MTCKDCVHYGVCIFRSFVAEYQGGELAHRNNVCCQAFKNKADFVVMKKAKWIYETRYYSCSFCGGKRFNLLLGTDAEYCSYCGAKMIFEKEGADNG